MTDSEITKAPRKTPEHQPWAIHCNNAEAVASLPNPEMGAQYDSLAEAEKACKTLAVRNVGIAFQPAKYGKTFIAKKEEKVVLQ